MESAIATLDDCSNCMNEHAKEQRNEQQNKQESSTEKGGPSIVLSLYNNAMIVATCNAKKLVTESIKVVKELTASTEIIKILKQIKNGETLSFNENIYLNAGGIHLDDTQLKQIMVQLKINKDKKFSKVDIQEDKSIYGQFLIGANKIGSIVIRKDRQTPSDNITDSAFFNWLMDGGISSIIPPNLFEIQTPGDCLNTCIKIMQKYNANYVKPDDFWALATKDNDEIFIHKECYDEAVKALDGSISNRVPVIVGVHYKSANINFDNITDHWVIVNGRGEDDKGVYYTYYEVAQKNATTATSTENNRFYWNENGYLEAIKSTTNSRESKPIITAIRLDKPNGACSRFWVYDENDKDEVKRKKQSYYNHQDKKLAKGNLIKIR